MDMNLYLKGRGSHLLLIDPNERVFVGTWQANTGSAILPNKHKVGDVMTMA